MTHTPPKTDEEWANLMVVRYAQFAKLSAEEGTNDGSLHSDEITNINIEIIHQIRAAERLATIEECAKVCDALEENPHTIGSGDFNRAYQIGIKHCVSTIRALTNQPHGNATGGGERE
jgi:hypothetical protein